MKFCEEITSINKEVTNLYRNAEDEERGSSGDLGVGGVSGETFVVCECSANLIFNKTINPTRTKTVLLIGMLVDQIVHHYYNPVHEDFDHRDFWECAGSIRGDCRCHHELPRPLRLLQILIGRPVSIFCRFMGPCTHYIERVFIFKEVI